MHLDKQIKFVQLQACCAFFFWRPLHNYPSDAITMITEPERDADMKFYEDRVRSEYLYTSLNQIWYVASVG